MGSDKTVETPLISVIVLNWNGKDDSLECLASLQRVDYPRFNVVFCDNGSGDGSIAAVRKTFSEVQIVDNGENLGYAEGNNRGIRYALEQGADAVVVLNNDTIVDPGFLKAFADAYASLPEVGMLGAVSFHYDKPDLIAAAGGYWDPAELRTRHIASGKPVADLPSMSPFPVEYIVGCAVFIPKEVVRHVGCLDADFFLNGEDVDWSLRIGKAGYINYTVPAAKIWHKIAVSFGGNSPLWWYFITRNQLLWTKRHLPPSTFRAVARKSIRSILPRAGVFERDDTLSIKDRYWRWRTWLRQIRTPREKASILARFFGNYHYFVKSFGPCPAELREKLTSPSSSGNSKRTEHDRASQ